MVHVSVTHCLLYSLHIGLFTLTWFIIDCYVNKDTQFLLSRCIQPSKYYKLLTKKFIWPNPNKIYYETLSIFITWWHFSYQRQMIQDFDTLDVTKHHVWPYEIKQASPPQKKKWWGGGAKRVNNIKIFVGHVPNIHGPPSTYYFPQMWVCAPRSLIYT